METRTRLDRIEVLPDGVLQVRMRKVFVDDAGVETPLGYHRTMITPLSDPRRQLDEVGAHLASIGAGAMDAGAEALIADVAAAVQTEARKVSFHARVQAAMTPPVFPRETQ